MGKIKAKRQKMELKRTLLSQERYRWYMQIQRLRKRGITVKQACISLRISRSEYYYWHRRVCEKLACLQPGSSLTALLFEDLSKAPHSSPKAYSDEVQQLIIRTRKRTNQGAEYIRFHVLMKYRTTLSVTGIHKVLKRAGLVKERVYHKKKKPYVVTRTYVPGEKIQVDTKYVKTSSGKTYYQYSAIDIATGIIFKQLFREIGPTQSCAFLRNLVLFFPFPLQKIQTDNGLEYTWRLNPDIHQTHHFTLQCQLLGLEHILIPPASPTYNSHVERTHRIDMEELWRKKRYHSFHSMQLDLRKYVLHFNHHRATPSKNWRTPIQFANEVFGLHITRLHYRVQDV